MLVQAQGLDARVCTVEWGIVQVIRLSKELPVVVEYKIEGIGYVRYYLAPKIEDEDMEQEEAQ